MTPAEYAAAQTCRHCGRSAHAGTWARAVMAALLNGGFAALTAITRPSSGSHADSLNTEA